MAQHAHPKPHRISRTLLRTALAVSAAGAALAGGGAATASAAEPALAATPDRGDATASAVTGILEKSVSGAPGAVKGLQLNPLAKTPVDPLANEVRVPVADFKPVSTKTVTGRLSQGAALKDMPVTGEATRVLPG
ncbi:hypothetical protein [Streptomyces chattanoogensis]|uniref:ATP-binding protein n=1 Tax=Streptomyces chattanoogensis TaxID=66876 RepID=A0A0N0XR69_9ACTN|nr:hypothetical protein [Streptomyces chattanoogensis]KPC59377.1 hypothetical protein ADL29_35615 [Streptomyces chattanoogensis]